MISFINMRFFRKHGLFIPIALLCIPLLSLTLAPQAAISPSIVLPQTSAEKEILLTVTVTDKQGRPVPNLPLSSFAVFDEKKPQAITFFSDKDIPLSVGIILDLSRSMTIKQISFAKEGLMRFVQLGHEANEYFIMSFDQQPHAVAGWTRDANTVIKTLNLLTPKQANLGTALYDTCYVAIDKLMQATHPKRVILLISDGKDNNSRRKYIDMRRFLQQSDVLVYSISINEGTDVLNQFGKEVLNEITRLSGGKAFFPFTQSEMNESFERIAYELRHQYQLGFKSDSTAKDGEVRRIKVEVRPGKVKNNQIDDSNKQQNLKARTREGYYVTKGG